MTSTIRDLTELLAVAPDDYILISDTSDVTNRDKRISKLNFSGGLMTGGGSVATGGFTLTVPATGVASLLGTAQTLSALKTFSAGLSFGQSTINWYEEGTWTPALTFGGLSTGMVYSNQQGYFTRIGNTVHAWATFGLTTVGSATGTAAIGGLPYPLVNAANFRPAVSLYASTLSYTGTLQAVLVNNSTALSMNANSNGAITNLTQTAFVSGSLIGITAVYRV
jgi:hypothetical protein